MLTQQKSQNVFVLVCAILLMCTNSPNMKAQSTASIVGAVTDSSGASIPNAIIRVRNIGTSVSQSTTTDAQGRYRMPNLQIGIYEVLVCPLFPFTG
jgi:hypothetical protein